MKPLCYGIAFMTGIGTAVLYTQIKNGNAKQVIVKLQGMIPNKKAALNELENMM